MKKIMLKCAIMFLSLCVISCTNEELENPNELLNGIEEVAASVPGSGGFMIAALVDEGACSINGRRYTVYATNNPAVNFDRTVNISIYKTVRLQFYK